MDSSLIPIVAAIVTVVLLAGGCATREGASSAANMPGTTAPTVGASGAPGETNFDWPASSR